MDHKQRNQVLGVLFVGVLMGALDIAIIGPAMPAIQAEFGLTPRQLPWLFSIYVLMQMIGLGLSALLGAPIRYITLNETTAVDRSAAQGMVTTFTSIGQLVAAALIGAVAASFGETAQGYDLSFLGIGLVTVALVFVALALKSRVVEQATRTS